MKDEIKELLEHIEILDNTDYILHSDKAKALLDYITNLQDEYEKEKYLVDKYTRQLTDEYKNTEYQCKLKEDYKSRIDKANEIIDEVLFVGVKNYRSQLGIIQKVINGE